MEAEKLDNPLIIPDVLSFLTYRRFKAEVKGLDAYPRDQWPDNVPLLYYAYLSLLKMFSQQKMG
jgi:cytochrome bd ubiquinol oxidase subunit I